MEEDVKIYVMYVFARNVAKERNGGKKERMKVNLGL